MKKLQIKAEALLEEVLEEFDSINLGEVRLQDFKVADLGARQFGNCSFWGDVKISKYLVEYGTDKEIKRTIAHELIHTMEGCFDHKSGFHDAANRYNRAFDNNISTNSTNADFEDFRATGPKPKYLFQCECGELVDYHRMCLSVRVLRGEEANRTITCHCGRVDSFTEITDF